MVPFSAVVLAIQYAPRGVMLWGPVQFGMRHEHLDQFLGERYEESERGKRAGPLILIYSSWLL
jgi:hypothetical protein